MSAFQESRNGPVPPVSGHRSNSTPFQSPRSSLSNNGDVFLSPVQSPSQLRKSSDKKLPPADEETPVADKVPPNTTGRMSNCSLISTDGILTFEAAAPTPSTERRSPRARKSIRPSVAESGANSAEGKNVSEADKEGGREETVVAQQGNTAAEVDAPKFPPKESRIGSGDVEYSQSQEMEVVADRDLDEVSLSSDGGASNTGTTSVNPVKRTLRSSVADKPIPASVESTIGDAEIQQANSESRDSGGKTPRTPRRSLWPKTASGTPADSQAPESDRVLRSGGRSELKTDTVNNVARKSFRTDDQKERSESPDFGPSTSKARKRSKTPTEYEKRSRDVSEERPGPSTAGQADIPSSGDGESAVLPPKVVRVCLYYGLGLPRNVTKETTDSEVQTDLALASRELRRIEANIADTGLPEMRLLLALITDNR